MFGVPSNLLDHATQWGWAVVVGGGAFTMAAKAVRGLWRIGSKMQDIYEQFQPNHGSSFVDRLDRIEKELRELKDAK